LRCSENVLKINVQIMLDQNNERVTKIAFCHSYCENNFGLVFKARAIALQALH